MSFLDALTPEAQKRKGDIYEAFHNPDGTRKQEVEEAGKENSGRSFFDKMKFWKA